MLVLAEPTVAAYERRMETAAVPARERPEYLRWVRFYLDFCQKYRHPPREETSIPAFLEKLASKNQSETASRQASRAISLLLRRRTRSASAKEGGETNLPAQDFQKPSPQAAVKSGYALIEEDCSARRISERPPSAPGVAKDTDTGHGRGRAAWEQEFRDLAGAIKLRNYSESTHEAYRMWVQRFRDFSREKPPGELDDEDVKGFLTDLAVGQGVAGSTQNQAFNALLFFFRHVLRREFGKLSGVVRAKRKPYVPVVLSRKEVGAVVAAMDLPYRLVVLLLYGCGLRLAECLELRVHCFNLESRLLTIHDGKGQKDRTVPLPERVMPEIRNQMQVVRETLRADLAGGFAGTFLPRQLGKKYKNAAREFIWQWFFPAATLTKVDEPPEKRRYHLHDSHVQAAVKRAAEAAGVAKRVSPHTFRHTFASHLLIAGYDLPTIQRLLGHGDVKTTMIYVQTVPSRKMLDAKSPLDL